MKTYIAIHNHSFGLTTCLFKSKKNYTGYYCNDNPIDPEIVSNIGVDFEPEREESLDRDRGSRDIQA